MVSTCIVPMVRGLVSIDLTKFLLVSHLKCSKSVDKYMRTNTEKNGNTKPKGKVSLDKESSKLCYVGFLCMPITLIISLITLVIDCQS